jgi:Mg2+ and Co2+ transporter CorA
MSRLSTILIPLLAILFFVNGFAQEEKTNWEKFSENLIWGLNSGNEGLERSAMCIIIKHADSLTVNQVSFNIYQIFSSHENPKVRQLALVALYKMNSIWVLKNLVDDIYDESDPIIRHQIATILKERPILMTLR